MYDNQLSIYHKLPYSDLEKKKKILLLLITTTLNGWVDGRTNRQTFQEIPHILLDFHLFTSSCHHAMGQKAPQGPLLGSDILTIPHLRPFSTTLPPSNPSYPFSSSLTLFPLIKGALVQLPYSCLTL